jgi:hypothetical protein
VNGEDLEEGVCQGTVLVVAWRDPGNPRKRH